MTDIHRLFDYLVEHEHKLNRSFSLIPSENMLSPLARLAFLSDGFSRYFFDEKEVFGRWSFQGGSLVGQIQQHVLAPLLRRVGGAEHVNLHPISGLSGMTLALAAFGGGVGSHMISVAPAQGGHPDTRYVGEKLGYTVHDLPFADWATPDLAALARQVDEHRPALIYIDHATALFPLDLTALVTAARDAARGPLHVHVDSSHVNGLIWAGCLPNPLDCGADSYGGSTHKTFPGPHKAVLFTRDGEIAERLILTAVNMISHHHTASVVALAIALLEFVECDGEGYCRQTLANAGAFAAALAAAGFDVQGAERGYTETHQVWSATPAGHDTYEAASALFDAGLVVNPFNPLPSLGGPGLRTGVNEATRLGLTEGDMTTLATCFREVLLEGRPAEEAGRPVAELRRSCQPAYCYPTELFADKLAQLAAAFEDDRRLVAPAAAVAG